MLGLERDNNLPLRGHIGTRDGRKGSAPLGRNYFLQNWEMDKSIYSNGLMAVMLGPFIDVGDMTDPGTAIGSQKWLFDTGAQVKLRVFSTTVAFSYGKASAGLAITLYVTGCCFSSGLRSEAARGCIAIVQL